METGDDLKAGCCSKTRCGVILFVFLLVSVAVVCVVTFTADVRTKVQYDTSDLQWWKKTPVYQVYPRSFKDTDDDGVGDLKGITEKLNYLASLGVEAIWISPFYMSPMIDSGYDVSNYTAVHPMFGNMQDFEELLKEAKNKNIKVILDFVPNHTSNESEWFEDSIDRKNGYDDFYVWVNGTSDTPPNNWPNSIGYSAWTWNEHRGQYYYHNYLAEQPDLNYRNSDVKTAIQNAMKFWLDKGVAGFRLDAVIHLFEAESLEDEVTVNGELIQNETQNLPEVFNVLKEWKTLLDEYTDPPRVMFSEVTEGNAAITKKYYDAGTIPFNFDLVKKVNKTCGGACVHGVIGDYLHTLQTDNWPTFLTGSHDLSRVATRMGETKTQALAMLLLTLPGTPIIYYGEEIGMTDVDYTFQESQDMFGLRHGKDGYKNYSRDPERSPMQWNSNLTSNAGFSNKEPWLHINSNAATVNVQVEEKNNSGIVHLYRDLIRIRRYPSFQTDKLEFAIVNENIISYIRKADGWQTYLVVINLGQNETTHDYSAAPVYSTEGKVSRATHNELHVGQEVSLTSLKIKPNHGVVIAVKYQKH